MSSVTTSLFDNVLCVSLPSYFAGEVHDDDDEEDDDDGRRGKREAEDDEPPLVDIFLNPARREEIKSRVSFQFLLNCDSIYSIYCCG